MLVARTTQTEEVEARTAPPEGVMPKHPQAAAAIALAAEAVGRAAGPGGVAGEAGAGDDGARVLDRRGGGGGVVVADDHRVAVGGAGGRGGGRGPGAAAARR